MDMVMHRMDEILGNSNVDTTSIETHEVIAGTAVVIGTSFVTAKQSFREVANFLILCRTDLIEAGVDLGEPESSA